MKLSDILFLWLPTTVGLSIPALYNFIQKKSTNKCNDNDDAYIAIKPKPYVFAIAWYLLYTMLGIIGFFVWRSSGRNIKDKSVLLFISLVVALNLWYILFYIIFCAPLWSFIAIVLILLKTIVITVIYTGNKKTSLAGWLLVPMILWLSFATSLSYLSL
jgi:tryptophan-rich sensory protein